MGSPAVANRRTEVARAYRLAEVAVFSCAAAVAQAGEDARAAGLASLERLRPVDAGAAVDAAAILRESCRPLGGAGAAADRRRSLCGRGGGRASHGTRPATLATTRRRSGGRDGFAARARNRAASAPVDR
jgi:hypothetical protein